MILHLLSQSPSTQSHVFTQTLTEGDTVLLIADACYYLQQPQLLIELTLSGVSLLALDEDAQLRGLGQQLTKNQYQVETCSSEDFVNLSLQATKIINW